MLEIFICITKYSRLLIHLLGNENYSEEKLLSQQEKCQKVAKTSEKQQLLERATTLVKNQEALASLQRQN